MDEEINMTDITEKLAARLVHKGLGNREAHELLWGNHEVKRMVDGGKSLDEITDAVFASYERPNDRKVWVRVGGYLRMTDREMRNFAHGTLTTKEIELIFARGFEVNGETYTPDTCDDNEGTPLDGVEASIDVGPIHMRMV